jgi:thiosulfate reductase cytochrome b subunit
MSSALAWVWENVVGLVVEDSQLAIGIVLALVVTGALSAFGDAVHPVLGWLLLALLVLVLLANLVITARRAKRRIA